MARDIALPSFILGYHGCDVALAEQVLSGNLKLQPSANDYDWLADGIYFWEHNPKRAFDYAKAISNHPHPSGQIIKQPAVIGAVIDLGYCLNLLDSRFIEMVKHAYEDTVKLFRSSDKSMPENIGGNDLVVRNLDCAVIRMLHDTQKQSDEPAFDTVRAPFFEGGTLYEGAGFAAKNHIQVCVRNHQSIIGYFRPLDSQGEPLKFVADSIPKRNTGASR